MNPGILVVDDEEKIRQIISNYLTHEGFVVYEAKGGEEALHTLKRNIGIDLVILDWMMPGMNGLEVCRKMREFTNMPIIFLTAKSDEVDKLVGLEIGGDDYITKPFSVRELAARIRVVLRRVGRRPGQEQKEQEDKEAHSSLLIRGAMAIDLERHQIEVHGREILLTPTEFKLLHTLAANPGRVYSRLQLLSLCLGEEYAGYERSIDTHISNLRKKVEEDPSQPVYIVTVFGVGYKFGEEK